MRAKGGRLSPLWARSPLVLRRYPGLAVAVTAGALLLAVAASSSPLFLSSAAGSAVEEEVRQATVYGAGFTLNQRDYLGVPAFGIRPAAGLPPYEERDAAFVRATEDVPGLAPRVLTLLSAPVDAAAPATAQPADAVRLLYRTGALDHVTKMAGSGQGVWLADNRAEQLEVEPGDSLALAHQDESGDRRTATVRVAGVYRALWKEPETPFWRSLYEEIYPPNPDSPPPPAFLLVDEAAYRSLTDQLRSFATDIKWELPLADPSPTLGEAEALERRLAELKNELEGRTSPAARTLGCGRLRCLTATLVSTVIGEAEEEVSALRGPADLLGTAGTLVALAVVAAAGAFLVARRRNEAVLLHARGMSPWAFAGKTAVETGTAALFGTAIGFAVALGVIAAAGPGGELESSAVVGALAAAAIRLPVALAVLALVATLVFLGLGERPKTRGGLLRYVPWEVGLLVVAGFCFERLTSGHALVEEAGGVERPSAYVLLFPIFFIAGIAGIAARAWAPALRALRSRSARLPAGPYLAVHRLAGAERLGVLLVAACALSLGIFVYAQTVVHSLERSVVAKSELFIGSDVNGTINNDQEPPEGFPYPVTKITRVVRGGETNLAGPQVDLLAVNPATLPEAAAWDTSWSDTSLESLARSLTEPSADALPVVVAGGSLPEETRIVIDSEEVPIEIVGTASAFPGMFRTRPLIVASADNWERVFDRIGIGSPLSAPGAETQLWVKGDERRAAAALASSSVRPYGVLTAAEIRNNPSIKAATRTFDFLRSLGFAAGLLAVVGMLLYLQARQRSRVVSFALSRRMGLRGAEHVGALVIELGAMLLLSLGIGIALALVAARVVLGDVDPLAGIPPDPLFVAPVAVLVATAVALAAASLLGGLLASRSAERANLSEVMRLAD